MKKTIALMLTLALCLGLLAACGGNNAPAAENTPAPAPAENTPAPAAEPTPAPATPEPTQEAEPEPAAPDFTTFRDITWTICGQDITWKMIPDGYNEIPSEHPMTAETVYYTTDAYGDGKTYEKFCRVYLPYGYDPEDKDTKYNVLYFQHGNAGSCFDMEHDTKSLKVSNIINNIFDPDHQLVEPCIIVCPTYYFEAEEGKFSTQGDGPAGDGRYEGIEALYHREVVEDLIPAVESRYNVYCTDFSEEGIKASRDHRAWSGYSRGGMCTWYMFHEDLAYFKYWIPMSCPCRPTNGTLDGGDMDGEAAFAYLKAAIDANPGADFFIYATAGGEGDQDLAGAMQEQIEYYVTQTDYFSFGPDVKTNNIYFTRSDLKHMNLYMGYSLALVGDVLFK